MCTHCQSKNLEEIKLSRRGRIYSFTVVMQRPPEYYKGPVPYAEGFVELPEGVRVETLFTDCNFDDLKVGMEVEMVIERLHEDEEGNQIMAFKFRPVTSNELPRRKQRGIKDHNGQNPSPQGAGYSPGRK